MAVRITTASAQINYVVVGYFASFLAALVAALAWGFTAAYVVSCLVLLGWVGFAARTFRGADEPIAPPRPWWRMTTRPASGFVLAALFAGQAAFLVVTTGQGQDLALPSAALDALVGAAYVHSSIRLRRGRRDRVDLAPGATGVGG